jgi:hypothetical protein
MSEIGKREKTCRAAKLLAHGVAHGHFSIHHIGVVLRADPRTLGGYISGHEPMPLHHQQRFAEFLTQLVPDMSRAGRNLLAQVGAARRFESGDTQTHRENAPHRFH